MDTLGLLVPVVREVNEGAVRTVEWARRTYGAAS